MAQNGPERSQMAQSCPKIGHKQHKKSKKSQNFTELGYIRSFFNICTGAQITEQKLKHDLNHQMSAQMIQENN